MKLPRKNVAEWAVFAVSLLLLAGVVAALLLTAARMGDAPPYLVVEAGRPELRGPTIEVPISIVNQGDRSAEEILVEVRLEGAEAPAEISFPRLAHGETAEGRAVFPARPGPAAASARVVSYITP